VTVEPEHTQRHHAFVVVVRSRVLRYRLRRARRHTSWLMLRSRYLIKRFPPDRRLDHELPGHV
jgi:hypothetical protein